MDVMFNFKTGKNEPAVSLHDSDDELIREFLPQDDWTQAYYRRERKRGRDKYGAYIRAIKTHCEREAEAGGTDNQADKKIAEGY